MAFNKRIGVSQIVGMGEVFGNKNFNIYPII